MAEKITMVRMALMGLTNLRMYGSKIALYRKVIAHKSVVEHRKVRVGWLKFGISNDELINSTGL
ncbi:hypothetical protein BT246_71830 (plasmid) [Bacillus thuringiensis]|uniref:Uncharacterized protein n=1 Tax=Bacillus thuringiensis TaxID=1428 RepID=A0A9W3X4V2_BACTU|nr:hypothetical protein BT246_71830 [Bacillus thuringiensis]